MVSRVHILTLLVYVINLWYEVNCSNTNSDCNNNDWDDELDEDYDMSYANHPCKRDCVAGRTMTCRYKFHAEWFYTMSKACYNCYNTTSDCFRKHCIVADGVARACHVINRMMPGPTIQVCYKDKIIIDLVNKMGDQTVTIHWHGHHQIQSPFMDGVPYITQCPIQPYTTFRYTMNATNCGTHWWHSHVGTQRGDGMYGAFIVRVPTKRDTLRKHYDYDKHVLVLNDWSHSMGMDKHLRGLLGTTFDAPDSILVNGMGPQWNDGIQLTQSPIYQINVTKEFRYRIRIINAGARACPIEVYIDKHKFEVASTDGENIKPVVADSLMIHTGERFDIVVCCDQPVDNYWIRFTGYTACGFNRVHQVCILHYAGANHTRPNATVGYANHDGYTMQVNPLNQPDNASNTIRVNDLSAADDPCLDHQDDDPSLDAHVPFKYFIELDFHRVNHSLYHHNPYNYFNVNSTYKRISPTLNSLSFTFPPSNLFSQFEDVDKRMFCFNRNLRRCDDQTFCSCIHMIQIPLYSTVELIFIDKGTFNLNLSHPMHLHGYSFYTVAYAKADAMNRSIFEELDKAGKVNRNLKNPCRKDVIGVPSPGYTTVRFWADNPGVWFLHCHVEPHLGMGMAAVLQVGRHDEFLKVPDGFPRCGNFNPNCKKEVKDSSNKGGVFHKLISWIWDW